MGTEIDIKGYDLNRYVCFAIAPISDNRCAIGFHIKHEEDRRVISVIFDVQDFNPKKSRVINVVECEMTSLTASANGKIYALDTTTTFWDFDGSKWSTQKVDDPSRNLITGGNVLGGPFIVGMSLIMQLIKGKWQALHCSKERLLMDVSNNSTHGLIACGENYVFRLENGNLREIKMPGGPLYACEIDSSGIIRVGGHSGNCFMIENDEISRVKSPKMHIRAIETINGSTYWIADEAILAQEKLSLKPIGPKKSGAPKFCYRRAKDAIRIDANGTSEKLKVVYEGGKFHLKPSTFVVAKESDDDDDDE